MPETQDDAIGVEVCSGVIAEKLWIAEDKAGAVIVERIPGGEGSMGVRSAAIRSAAIREE